MEVYVGVASKEWDVIDEEFGKNDNPMLFLPKR